MSPQVRLTVYAALATMATATSLTSIFSDSAWLVPVMGGIVIVAAACGLVRASPLPSALEPIAATIGVLIWLTILDARAKAHLGAVPGRLAFRHLGKVARAGFTQIHDLPTPTPAHQGVVFLTVIGVAAIALVVDLLTVTLRRASLSGLPLLALFTVCAATARHGINIIAFAVSAVGYLALLYADNREKVLRWGAAIGAGSRARPASAWSTDGSGVPAPASLARQVGAIAISLGVIVPLFVPGLHSGIDRHGNGDGSGDGGGTVRTFDPIVKIGAYLKETKAVPLITYASSSSSPGYLRLTSLDMFNGSDFHSGTLEAPASAAASESLPIDTSALVGPDTTTGIHVLPSFSSRWLPVVPTLLGVNLGNPWRFDPNTATIFSAVADASGLSYTTRSVTDSPTPRELAAVGKAPASLAPDLLLGNRDVPSSVQALTKRVTAGATTPYAKALAIQRFFTSASSHFRYDTSIPPDNSRDALADFLLHTRRGFCQQYSTAMAVMARLVGIPSRVAVGFTRGTYSATTRTWTVTSRDAHAWPELYFDDYGWLQFEPTPRGDGQAVEPSYAKSGSALGGALKGKSKPAPAVEPTIGNGHRTVSGPAGGSTSGSGQRVISRSENIARWVAVAVALLLMAFLLIPGTARIATRRRRIHRMGEAAGGSAAAWAELRDSAIDYRSPWDDRRSPRQIAMTLLDRLDPGPPARAAMLEVAAHEERSRYAAVPPPTDPELRHHVAVVRSAMAATATRWQRVTAAILPRSTLSRAMDALSTGADRISNGLRELKFKVRRLRPARS